ncbi:putative membrane protein [Synechococcus sp. TAK9802]|nr:putative membrane protein [Synechococcus sp. TAK9802]
MEALVSTVLGVLLAWFTTRLIIWFFSPDRYRRDRRSEDG